MALRVQKELRDIMISPLKDISVVVDDDNIKLWKCSIKADHGTPYAGGTFHLNLDLSPFPLKPPEVRFTTKIYHPGINEQGQICVPLLSTEWKPAVSLSTILKVVQEKLNNPSPDDPYDVAIADLLRTNKAKFLAEAKDQTKKYAMSPAS